MICTRIHPRTYMHTLVHTRKSNLNMAKKSKSRYKVTFLLFLVRTYIHTYIHTHTHTEMCVQGCDLPLITEDPTVYELFTIFRGP